jgi:hypothetical protein
VLQTALSSSEYTEPGAARQQLLKLTIRDVSQATDEEIHRVHRPEYADQVGVGALAHATQQSAQAKSRGELRPLRQCWLLFIKNTLLLSINHRQGYSSRHLLTRGAVPQVEHLYERPPPKADGTPAKQEGDCMIISGDIYCNQHTALAARTAAGCASEVGCSPVACQGSG